MYKYMENSKTWLVLTHMGKACPYDEGILAAQVARLISFLASDLFMTLQSLLLETLLPPPQSSKIKYTSQLQYLAGVDSCPSSGPLVAAGLRWQMKTTIINTRIWALDLQYRIFSPTHVYPHKYNTIYILHRIQEFSSI